MLKKRLIPVLQIYEKKLVKTIRYKKINYIGDPINTIRIFNSLEVDEMIILDIEASKKKISPNFDLLDKLAQESFVPLSYGGNVKNIYEAEKIFKIGFEKIVLNSSIMNDIEILNKFISQFGKQAIVVSIDIKKDFFGNINLYSNSGSKKSHYNLDSLFKIIKEKECGEILVNDIDREGTWSGLNHKLAKTITGHINIPIIINGGAKNLIDISNVLETTNISGVGVGNIVVYQKKGMGVLINYPKLV